MQLKSCVLNSIIHLEDIYAISLKYRWNRNHCRSGAIKKDIIIDLDYSNITGYYRTRVICIITMHTIKYVIQKDNYYIQYDPMPTFCPNMQIYVE